jgi:serine/threonine protein kinase
MSDGPAELFHRVDAVFDEALDVSVADRAAFLDSACAGDAGLRAAVEELLSAHDSSASFLNGSAAEFAAPLLDGAERQSGSLPLGERVGPFRIVREIGHGGMGTVYLAERSDGHFEQRVALKVIRHAASGALVARFLEERRILALLQHSRIAHLVDGGVSPDGEPWFAMEYVEGEPIDRYCDAKAASIDERLSLFDAVCDAVQYAHAHLIVHRDLKPSNILVTADGRIKLLDFGIAKMLDPIVHETEDGEAEPPTRLRAMTPEYAAPEQVLGQPVSTATDVYALGILLYVLLTGQRPYDVRHRSAADVERIVCEIDPPRPSAMVSDPAATTEQREFSARQRRTSPDRLSRALRGDLDTIVMQALRKEPARRYASAAALREDVRRFRERRPVLARGDGAGYRLRKFSRRHATGLALSIAAGAFLAAAGIRERVLRGRAEAGTRKAEQTTDFMIGLFKASENGRSFRDTLTASDLLTRGVTQANAMSAQPELQAQMFDVIGQLETGIGELDKARPLLESALALRRKLYGDDHPDVATTLDNLAEVAYRRGDMRTAVKLRSEELAIRRKIFGNSDVKTTDAVYALAGDLHASGRPRDGDSLFSEWVARVAGAPREVTPARARQLDGLANIAEYQQHYDDAARWLREELSINRELYGDRSDRVASTMAEIALLLNRQTRGGDADTLMQRAIEILRADYPDGHPQLARDLRNWAVILEDLSRFGDAEPHLRESLAIYERFEGAASIDAINTKLELAHTLTALGRYDEAVALSRDGLEAYGRKYDDKSPMVNRARLLLGDALRGQGRFAEAEPLLIASYSALSGGSAGGLARAWSRNALQALVRLYDAEGKPQQAAKYRSLLGR